MTPHLASWSPATDTHEIRTDLRGPYFERETAELHLLDLYPPTVTRVTRPSWAAALRKLAGVLLLVAALLALSAQPANARPLIEPERYYGPSVTQHFAGLSVAGQVTR